MEPPVFVMGCRRSGTTLLALILDGHSRLAVYPESYFYTVFAPRRHRYGDLGRRANLIHLIEDVRAFLGAQSGGMRFRIGELLDALPSPSFEGVFAGLLALHARRQGKLRGGDKTPGHYRFLDQIAADFPASPIVFVVRDPRDTILSIREAFGGTLAGAAWTWNRAVGCYLVAQQAIHLVRYEELVADPERVVAGACARLGERFEPAMLDHVARVPLALPRTPRIHRRLLGPIDAASVGRFRQMPADQVAWIEGACAEGMAALGYAPVSASVPRVMVSRPSKLQRARRRLAYYRTEPSRIGPGWRQWRTLLAIRVRGVLRSIGRGLTG